ncbi:MAG: beta-N-acetylhexosaminidase [Solirubrobacteraceae bacterium]|nr:beta-N-acetylhexosaminidase [Solirubrobacteraceae bacterium]
MRLPPRDTPARRRLVALAVAAVLALALGVVIGASAGDEDAAPAERPAAKAGATAAKPRAAAIGAAQKLSLRRQAGQLVVMRFNGPGPPAYVPRALKAGRAAGVILFKDNIASRADLTRLVGTLQRAAGGSAIVSTDQEGGEIRNLPWARPAAGQAAAATPDRATADARGSARDLRAAGINVNLAPVGDVGTSAGSAMRGRAFPGDAGQVAALTAAAVRGYRGTGVAATVKHFPGLGAATENTDDAPVSLTRTPVQLLGEDLPPFRAAIKARVPLVMASHALYPSLDANAIASQSRYVLHRLLRERLGFGGVVVTDSLEARAVTERSGPAEAAVRSVRAGADLILTTGAGSHLQVLRAIIAEARRSPGFRRRVAESAARVLALKRDLGLRAPSTS